MRLKEKLPPRKCLVCGQLFEPKRRESKYCSERCSNCAAHRKYNATHQQPKRYKRKEKRICQCAYCGKDFVARGDWVKYCSAKCAYHNQLKKRREANAARLMVKCAVCGKEFHSPRGTAKYCSRKCLISHQVLASRLRRERRSELLAELPEDERKAVIAVMDYNRYTRYSMCRRDEAEKKDNRGVASCGENCLGLSKETLSYCGSVFDELLLGK
jgi:predicted nucleic acid-binding Zn ribbon protein